MKTYRVASVLAAALAIVALAAAAGVAQDKKEDAD